MFPDDLAGDAKKEPEKTGNSFLRFPDLNKLFSDVPVHQKYTE